MTDFEMTEEEFDECEQAERQKHDDKVKELVDFSLRCEFAEDFTDFQNGAEFGYNKANEWRYVNWKYFADKDYPESETASYLVQLRNKDTLICEWETEEGFGCFWDSNLEPIDNDDVYAWKEIVLPKESE